MSNTEVETWGRDCCENNNDYDYVAGIDGANWLVNADGVESNNITPFLREHALRQMEEAPSSNASNACESIDSIMNAFSTNLEFEDNNSPAKNTGFPSITPSSSSNANNSGVNANSRNANNNNRTGDFKMKENERGENELSSEKSISISDVEGLYQMHGWVKDALKRIAELSHESEFQQAQRRMLCNLVITIFKDFSKNPGDNFLLFPDAYSTSLNPAPRAPQENGQNLHQTLLAKYHKVFVEFHGRWVRSVLGRSTMQQLFNFEHLGLAVFQEKNCRGKTNLYQKNLDILGENCFPEKNTLPENLEAYNEGLGLYLEAVDVIMFRF